MNIYTFRNMYEKNIAGRLAYRLYDMTCIKSDIDYTMFDMLITLSGFCPEDVVDDDDYADDELLDVWRDILDYFAYDFCPPSFFSESELDELNCYIIRIGFEIDDILDTIKDSPTYYL